MSSFLALYRGATIGEARIIAVTADPDLVADVATRMLRQPPDPDADGSDPVVASVEAGRRKALHLISRESTSGGDR